MARFLLQLFVMNAKNEAPVAQDSDLNEVIETPRDGKLTIRKNKLKNLTVKSGLKGGRTCEPTNPRLTWWC